MNRGGNGKIGVTAFHRHHHLRPVIYTDAPRFGGGNHHSGIKAESRGVALQVNLTHGIGAVVRYCPIELHASGGKHETGTHAEYLIKFIAHGRLDKKYPHGYILDKVGACPVVAPFGRTAKRCINAKANTKLIGNHGCAVSKQWCSHRVVGFCLIYRIFQAKDRVVKNSASAHKKTVFGFHER